MNRRSTTGTAGEIQSVEIVETRMYETARTLTSGEIENLAAIYGSEVDWSAVRVRKGSLLLIDSDALTIDNLISFDATYYHDDFTVNLVVNDLSLLAHEICHVWQHQDGVGDYR